MEIKIIPHQTLGPLVLAGLKDKVGDYLGVNLASMSVGPQTDQTAAILERLDEAIEHTKSMVESEIGQWMMWEGFHDLLIQVKTGCKKETKT